VRRAVIGIAGQAGMLTQSARRALQIDSPSAVEVMSVAPNGPAAQAGIRAGDVIFKIEGKPVASVDGLRRVLERLPNGAQIGVSLIRMGSNGPAVAEAKVRVVVATSRAR